MDSWIVPTSSKGKTEVEIKIEMDGEEGGGGGGEQRIEIRKSGGSARL